MEHRLGVAARVVERIVRVLRLAQVLERALHVLDHALVERAKVLRREPERVLAEKMMEVPAHELPVEAVVVGDERRLAAAELAEPCRKTLHLLFRIGKPERLLAREAAD